jgi:hypothetical protein
VGWLRRFGVRVAMVAASVAAVSSVGAVAVFAVLAIGGSDGIRGGAGSGSVAAFNACIGQSRFLVLEENRAGNKIIETLKDRANGAVVGQFALLPSVRAAESLRTPLQDRRVRSVEWPLCPVHQNPARPGRKRDRALRGTRVPARPLMRAVEVSLPVGSSSSGTRPRAG